MMQTAFIGPGTMGYAKNCAGLSALSYSPSPPALGFLPGTETGKSARAACDGW
jgi:hypothetical protein